ncbi:dihydroorotase family protein [Kordiimonas sp. SCSIO 12610]|uniref:dihydroorotase n=1 Tax=Kordiimonas sp. SCSIO 12610 TaxID=2829597 RepID=UPI00210B33A4|nr:dihydroorotase [Kordiimonas sp. SCSIO 12610]UTW54253.1 dihydroorotase [Kordiimonas sp. SCSIO 12610]
MIFTAYTNARIINPVTNMDEIGSVFVNDGRIVDLGAGKNMMADARVIDCTGKILCPGFIDMRAHAVDAEAAAAGGITSIALQPDQKTVLDNDAAIERIVKRSHDHGGVRVYPVGAATKELKGSEIAEIGQMQASGAIAFTDCRQSINDAQVMRRLMEYAKYFDAPIVQFAEEQSLAKDGFAHEGEIATRLGLNGIPSAAEAIQIERDIRLADLTGAKLHIALVSTKEGVQIIRNAKKRKSLNLTCSVSPHHLYLNDNALEGYRTFAKVSPPLRSEADRLALIKGLADGVIDTVVSDHDPRSEDVKRLPLAQAASGVAGFETMLPILMTLVHSDKISMMTAIRALTENPAKILGVKGGSIEKGSIADITIFDPEKPWRIDNSKLKSSARNTPFDTLPTQGKVWKTIVAGKEIYSAD